MLKKGICFSLVLLLLINTTAFAAQGVTSPLITNSGFAFELAKRTSWIPAEGSHPDPKALLTWEEAASMAVSALGYDMFKEPCMTLAEDFGLFEGIDLEKDALVEWDEYNLMLSNIDNRLQGKIKELNGFYAIQSYSQIEMIDSLSSVGFGWSRLEYREGEGLVINTKRQGSNEYAFPAGYEEPLQAAKDKGATALLMIALDYSSYPNGQSLASYFLSSLESRQNVAALVAKQMSDYPAFDGVVIDFENIRADQKENFTAFLQAVKSGLQGKKLYVAVQPVRKQGLAYFDGYDYRAIGSICDKIILMAHDYAPKALTQTELELGYTTTPVAPIDEVYYALKAITDKKTGVEDRQKVMLQLSFDAVALKVQDGKMTPDSPAAFSYTAIENESLAGAEVFYSKNLESPYIKFTKDNIQYVVWYEDAGSIAAKIKLAKMFGIQGLSLWRLGIIPNSGNARLNIWQTIVQNF